MSSGIAKSWLSWAQKRSPWVPTAPAQLPRCSAGGIAPLFRLRHCGWRPCAHAAHGGSIPRGAQPSHGSSTTRSPVSVRRATASWPSTCGNESSAVSGLSRAPWRRICMMSDPQMPLAIVSQRTQPGAGGSGSGTSSSPTGAYPARKPRGLISPVTLAAASRGRLWWKTRAFNSSSAVLDGDLVVQVAHAVACLDHRAEGQRDADRALRPLDVVAHHAPAEIGLEGADHRSAGNDPAAEDELVEDVAAADRMAVLAGGDADRPHRDPALLLDVVGVGELPVARPVARRTHRCAERAAVVHRALRAAALGRRKAAACRDGHDGGDEKRRECGESCLPHGGRC